MKAFVISLLICAMAVLNAQPGTVSDHLRIDQFGYPPDVQKVCVISNPINGFDAGLTYTPGTSLEVREAETHQLVLSGPAQQWHGGATYNQSGDQIWWFDFSSLTTQGSYYIYDPANDTRSFEFAIGNEVYHDALKQAVRVFFLQRSGFAKSSQYAGVWQDLASHLGPQQDLDCRQASNPVAATSRSLEGGWFDAGDFNKYVNFAYGTLHDLLFAYLERPEIWSDDYNIPESGNGLPDLLDEIKWEMDWLKRMQSVDGSVLMKVSVTQWQTASPASADTAVRRYGQAQASSTRTAASCFALAAIAYEVAGMSTYADSLEDCAIAAWNWLQANPGYSNYNNSGFFSANPELNAYQQFSAEVGAAIALFARTGNTIYRTYVDNNYSSIQPMLWTSWYPFESTIQDLLLYYTSLPGATTSVVSDIEGSFLTSMQNSGQLENAIDDSLCGYRAYLYSSENVWGSHRPRCHVGSMFYNMIEHDLAVDTQYYRDAAMGFINFIHGVNPINLVMLTNMGDFGAEQSANEMYHGWFGDGTVYDNAQTSLYGPPPGYITGGFNQYYQPDGAYGGTISPPQNQPPLKAYLDWNTGWPENSWEITEPSIYNQAAYVKLLSRFVVGPSCNLNVTSSADAGAGSLRAAITCAAPGDTVIVQVDSVYLTNVSVNIDKQVAIVGVNNPVILSQPGSALFDIGTAGVVFMSGLSLLRENTIVSNAGELVLQNVSILRHNATTTPAIINTGTLFVDGVVGLEE